VFVSGNQRGPQCLCLRIREAPSVCVWDSESPPLLCLVIRKHISFCVMVSDSAPVPVYGNQRAHHFSTLDQSTVIVP
jgi:hypothetical protein